MATDRFLTGTRGEPQPGGRRAFPWPVLAALDVDPAEEFERQWPAHGLSTTGHMEYDRIRIDPLRRAWLRVHSRIHNRWFRCVPLDQPSA